ncbi:MAG: hypothetical protein DRO93_08640 [Candidatus Thorarchaeota archaeon]|nr:MAG: hypothetical protein DRO93_08640 [Candidatus Thorarchaeota archaeon]
MTKLGELLQGKKEWRELFNFTMDILNAGEKTKDSAVYMIGMRLTKLLSDLANVEIGGKDGS